MESFVELKSKININRDKEQKKVVDALNAKKNFKVGEEWLKHGIEWQSNSSAGLPNFLYGFQYLLHPELKKFLMHSANIKMGQWIGEFVEHLWLSKISMNDALIFIKDMAKRYTPNEFATADNEKMDKFIEYVEKYINEIIYHIKEVAGDNKVVFEHPVNLYLHGLNVPITGWLDVAIFDKDDETKLVAWIENKTSYPKPKGHYKKNTGNNKVGDRRWESPSFPLTPSVRYEPQMSIYYKATNILGHQIHCTPNGTQLFRPEEHETLQKEHLEGVLKGIYQKLMVRQNLLKLCNDAETFMRLSEPDFKYWKIQDWNPEYKQLLRGVYDY
tara:strand:+ start:647 stop:1633 length:987 start_codon:yes stop_codon:yes gene_type:complete